MELFKLYVNHKKIPPALSAYYFNLTKSKRNFIWPEFMAENTHLKFKLTGQTFHEIDPDIKINNMNPMAFVSRVQNDQPDKIEVEFDGNPEAMMFLIEIAQEIGFYANIEGNLATFEKV